MTAEARLTLPQLTLDSADAGSRPVLEKAKAQVGFIPNMYKGMANLPGLGFSIPICMDTPRFERKAGLLLQNRKSCSWL
ncbi:hypothetical protein ES707_13221 [subsurface metagenome]